MSQTNRILEYLKQGHTITPLEALDKFSCFRLGARILEIKKLDYKIETIIIKQNDKHFASYKLKKGQLEFSDLSVLNKNPERYGS